MLPWERLLRTINQMSREDDSPTAADAETQKRGRGPGRQYPVKSVAEAATLAEAIRDHNASKPMNRLLLADAMGLSPTGATFRDLVAGSAKYGFTKGNYNSEQISLTPRGELLVERSPERRLEGLRQGIRAIPVFEKALAFYHNGRLPGADLLTKAVQQAAIGVDKAWAPEFAVVFPKSAREVGFLREISGIEHILLDAGPPAISTVTREASGIEFGSPEGSEEAAESSAEERVSEQVPDELRVSSTGPRGPKALQFFVAHGSNHVPLDQLKAILQQFGIPFVVAQDEPNAGRPISQKIKDLMDECTGGIFIFSADEEFKSKDGLAIWRPRENVIFELGAASYLYGRSIVIFKESDVTFPSDFRDLGWITFERDRLDAKAMELMKELIALKALRLVAGE